MRKIVWIAMTALAVHGTQQAHAQVDPHFSSYYVYPAWLNPALTGAFDGQMRVSGIYRSQWGNVSTPFSTPGVAFDINTDKNMSYGLSLMRQTAGKGGYSYTTAYGNLAYTGVQSANGMKRLVLALQIGMIQRRFDPTKLTFGDQWNPITGYSSSNPTTDFISGNNQSALDFGAGFLYFDATPGKKANFFGGYAASHINKPKDKFSAVGGGTIPMRHTIHAGVRINLNDRFSLTPNALYLRQGTASETMIGAYGQMKVNDNNDFMLGANYRFKDALAPFVGYTFGNMMISTSYDINMSDLGRVARGSNSFELSLTFIKKRKVETPEGEFVCPRL
jgi:type IX secretion system PorP/SprF family membrane protein